MGTGSRPTGPLLITPALLHEAGACFESSGAYGCDGVAFAAGTVGGTTALRGDALTRQGATSIVVPFFGLGL
ncbi:hypothetical protein [Kribbella swartbergensis]